MNFEDNKTEELYEEKEFELEETSNPLQDDEQDNKQNDEDIDEQIYPLNKIRIEKKSFSLFEIKRQCLERKEIILDSDFQRNAVWGLKQKSELIESILMKLPIPVFYFFQTEEGKTHIVDGQQRIRTIIEYMENNFKLAALNVFKEIKGKRFKELQPVHQRLIEDYSIEVYVIQPPTPEKVMYDIFDRVNRGGTKLNKQEMRNALYQGKSTRLLKRLAEDQNFKKLVGFSQSPKNMKDRYLILRFLAFYLYFSDKDIQIEYKGIDDFLAETMKYMNKMEANQIENLAQIFQETMQYITQYYNEDIFRFASQNNKKRPINMLLFESFSYLFTLIRLNGKQPISQEEIDALKNEFQNSEKLKSGVEGKNSIEYRFAYGIEKYIKDLR